MGLGVVCGYWVGFFVSLLGLLGWLLLWCLVVCRVWLGFSVLLGLYWLGWFVGL